MKIKSGSFKQKLVLGFVFVLIFSYTVYHLSTMFGDDFSTYAAGVTTETTVLNSSGYVFRNETVLTSPYSGAVDYKAKDGTKVSQNQELAAVYELGAQERERIRSIDDNISVLEKSLKVGSVGTDMGELKKSVNATYSSLVKMLADKDTGRLSSKADSLLIEMNGMSVVAEGDKAQIYQTLDSLRAEREAILAQSGSYQTYTAESSGYFYSQTDGLEEHFDLKALNELTAESFYSLLSVYEEQEAYTDFEYGKMCYDIEWGLVMPVDLSGQSYFKSGSVYSATFEENNRTVIPLTVDRIIEAPEYKTALIVFRTDRLPDNFLFERCQGVSITVDSISGIYVPKNAVERVDGDKGVYIMRGNVVHFRYIDIVYEGDDYYLVDSDSEDSEGFTYLKANDFIILKGKNLFDGRVFD